MTKTIEQGQSNINPEFLWTVERYHRAIKSGTLTEADQVELLNGKIIEHMPSSSPHSEAVNLTAEFFQYKYGRQYRYRMEQPITLVAQNSEPEPDFAIVEQKGYGKSHPVPGEILLVVEVANTSLEIDRNSKARLYAAAGLPEYWIINLIHRQIEIYTNPITSQSIYTTSQVFGEAAILTSKISGEVSARQFFPFGG